MTSCIIFQICCGLKLAKLVLLIHRINNQRDYIEELSLQTPQQKKNQTSFSNVSNLAWTKVSATILFTFFNLSFKLIIILSFGEFFSLMLITHTLKISCLIKLVQCSYRRGYTLPPILNSSFTIFFNQVKEQIGQAIGLINYVFHDQLNFKCFWKCWLSIQKQLKEFYEIFHNLLCTSFTLA